MTSSHIRHVFTELRQSGLDGDETAARRLESRFGEGLSRLVRRVIRKGRGAGALGEFILHEARSIQSQPCGLEREELVSELTSRVCALIAGQGIAMRIDTVATGDMPTVSAA